MSFTLAKRLGYLPEKTVSRCSKAAREKVKIEPWKNHCSSESLIHRYTAIHPQEFTHALENPAVTEVSLQE